MNTGLKHTFGRPLALEFDLDYRFLLRVAISKGFVIPSYSQQVIQNQLVLDLKSNGIWNKLDALYIFINDAGLDFMRLNWIKPKQNEISYTPDNPTYSIFNINENYRFNSNIIFNYIPNIHADNYQINNCSWGFYKDPSDEDSNEVQMGAHNEYESTGALINPLSNVSCAINFFNNEIIINKSGYMSGTRNNFSPGQYKYSSFHSVHLLNDVGNYALNDAFDNAVTNVPEGLPSSSFNVRISGNYIRFKLAYIGAYLTLAEKATFKNLIDQYKINVNN